MKCFWGTLSLLIVFCLPIFAFAGEVSEKQISDVNGWDKVRWGMTDEEIRAKYANLIDEEADFKNGYSPFFIETEIISISFKVRFIFDNEKKKLIRISLHPQNSEDNSISLFNRLEELMIAKYGTPHKKKDDIIEDEWIGKVRIEGSKTFLRTWCFLSTSINLIYLEIRTIKSKRLCITYEYNPKNLPL